MDIAFDFCTSFFEMRQAKKKVLAGLKTFGRETLALSENYCSKPLRQTFAFDEKLGGLENHCAKPLRLMKN
jgi:hypothetical protein